MATVPDRPQATRTKSVLRDHRTLDPNTLGATMTGTGVTGGGVPSNGMTVSTGGAVDGGATSEVGTPGAGESLGMSGSDGNSGTWAEALPTDMTDSSAVAASAPSDTRARWSSMPP